MKPFLFLLFSLTSLSSPAQLIEHYYDYAWNLTEPTEARFYALIEKQDSVWHRQGFFVHERKLQMDGSFLDSSCKIKQGFFHFYHANGDLKSVGAYLNDKKQGLWLEFYNNGILTDSTAYKNGHPIGLSLHWHRNTFVADSSVWNEDGSGVRVSWFDDGTPAAAGFYSAGGKQKGKWQYFHRNGKLSSAEIYDNGKLLSKQYYDESGTPLNDTTNRDRAATFPGGGKAWLRYMEKELYFPPQYKIENADKAIVVVDAVIDEEGNVTDVEVSAPFYPEFDKIAVRMMQKSPKWLPAIVHNRRVKYYVRQPVAFAQK